ncbi:putative DNA-binding domain-containing protein [Curvibacter sp. APW13]|uniref:HvfC/BufC family peptide modification chaperone n=1 Tax=Curvibacter sp. APW13 TaxID=3077236 RepID=UPI0028DE1B55|nr:putative DNA-binding domain-containing protein [Curvibacter sp. APW13]MDT8990407.1 putative DNA-binding domain-containing protein [Curvibacter sp. APW13]
MENLARQQAALLQALLDWPAQDAMENLAVYAVDMRGRGLKAYQANAHALAQRALRAAYPVIAHMLGEDSFADLARALWHADPPRRGDVALWGQGLARFVLDDPQLAEHPYLADVARCEWVLHRAAFAADAQPQSATLELLTSQDPATLGMELVPGTACVCSAWPVASLLGAHLQGEPTLPHVAQLLHAGVAQDVVVWRQGLHSRWREALPGESVLLQALLDGRNVLAAAEAAAPTLDFSRWLPLAVETGMLLRVTTEGSTA